MREYVEKQLHTRVDCEPNDASENNDAKTLSESVGERNGDSCIR